MLKCAYCIKEIRAGATLCLTCTSILQAEYERRDDTKSARYAPARSIIETVAAQYGLSEPDLSSRTGRISSAPFARKLAMYLLAKLTALTLPEIARLMGVTHHATVIYARDGIEAQAAKSPEFAKVVSMMAGKCGEVASA